MEQSIEQLWRKGFLEKETLEAPVIHNLYSRKSQLVTDKIFRTFKTNNYLLIPFALLLGTALGYYGHWLLGVYSTVIFTILFSLNRKKMGELERLDIKSDTYHYLLEFKQQSDNIIRYYTRLLAFGTPIVVWPTYWVFFSNDPKMIEAASEAPLWVSVFFVLFITLLLSGVGVGAYRLELKMMYGKYYHRIDEMIRDMEELRKG